MKTIQIEGKNPVLEALRNSRPAEKIYYLASMHSDEKVIEILRRAQLAHIPIFTADRKFLDKISRTAVNQGIIGFFEALPEYTLEQFLRQHEADQNIFFALFTEIEFEQNLGAVLRTAEAGGVSAVVIPPSSKGMTPVVERVSMGAASYVPVISGSLFPSLKLFNHYGYSVIGLESGGSEKYNEADLRGRVVFVIGGENKGITLPVRQRCDCLVYIPQKGKISSLNLSVAFGIVVFEKLRQEACRTDRNT